NRVLGIHAASARPGQSLASLVGSRLPLPHVATLTGLDLVGARPCLYGEGRVEHIMYTHNGREVSVFVLPHPAPDGELTVLGYEAIIGSIGARTFVLIAREPRAEARQMASVVRASLQ